MNMTGQSWRKVGVEMEGILMTATAAGSHVMYTEYYSQKTSKTRTGSPASPAVSQTWWTVLMRSGLDGERSPAEKS